MENSWYDTIKKPSWAPEPWVFGRVWSVLYIIIFAVNIYVLMFLSKGQISWKVALPFWLNLFFNFIFTPIQFGLRNQFLASLVIVAVLVTIIWSMIAIWPSSKWLTLAFIPYLVWVGIATVLQLSIWWLNR